MSNEKQIEQEIQDKGLNAPRLTPDHIDSKIAAVRWVHGGEYTPDRFKDGYENDKSANCLTICILTLDNGFTVTGESACASPENFDVEIGKKIAYQNAREKIWPLEGYLLKEKLHQAVLPPKSHIERMQIEKQELDLKLSGLKSFFSKLGTEQSPLLTDNQVHHLELQSEAMEQYSNILGARIEYDSELLQAIGG